MLDNKVLYMTCNLSSLLSWPHKINFEVAKCGYAYSMLWKISIECLLHFVKENKDGIQWAVEVDHECHVMVPRLIAKFFLKSKEGVMLQNVSYVLNLSDKQS